MSKRKEPVKSVMTTLSALSVLASLALAMPARAGGGADGTRGGGQTIDIGAVPHLRDLYDNCYWKNAKDFLMEQKDASEILNALKETHWIMADAFVSEANRLQLCKTGTLEQIPADDFGALTVVRDGRKRQVGIRANDLIFIDIGTFNRMPERERALLVLHEVVHSFIPMDVDQRNGKVRSIINAVSENDLHRVSREEFARQMKMNEVQIVGDTTGADAARADIEVVLSQSATAVAKLAALHRAGFTVIDENLWSADVVTAEAVAERFYAGAVAAVQNGDLTRLAAEMSKGLIPEFKFEKSASGSERESLLDLASSHGSDAIVSYLLEQGSTLIPGQTVSAVDRILERIIRGELKVVSLSKVMSLGADPNHLMTVTAGGQTYLVTALTAALVAGKNGIAETLSLSDKTSAQTVGEAMAYTIGDAGRTMAAGTLEMLLRAHKVDLGQAIKDGESALALAVTAKSPQMAQALLAAGANPNGLTAEGSTVFAAAISGGAFEVAGVVASQPGFDSHSVVTSPLGGSEASRVEMLMRFVDLNLTDLVSVMVKEMRFSWFDLYRARDTARDIKKNQAMADVITQAMQR